MLGECKLNCLESTSSVLCTFSEISMLNNSSIAMFPYPYILCMDGILLQRIFMDLKLICLMCGKSIKTI